MFRVARQLTQPSGPVVIPPPSTMEPSSDLGPFSVTEAASFLEWVAEAFRQPTQQPAQQPKEKNKKKGKSHRIGMPPCRLHTPKSAPLVLVRNKKPSNNHWTCAGYPTGKCPQTREAAMAQQRRRRGELCNRCGLAESRAKKDGTYTDV